MSEKYIYHNPSGTYTAKAYLAEQGRLITIGTKPTLSEALKLRQDWLVANKDHPLIEGFTANTIEDKLPNDVLLTKAQEIYSRQTRATELRGQQVITLPSRSTLHIYISDLHFGSSGVDYEWAFSEAEMIAKNENVYVHLLGDPTDNFVLKQLSHVRYKSEMSIAQEIQLLKYYLSILQGKVLTWVGGNHDKWLEMGQDYWREFVSHYCPNALFDQEEIIVDINHGQWSVTTQLRHSFKGRSKHNVTYALEEYGNPAATIRVQGHFHNCAVVRDFITAYGVPGKAIQLGAYKRHDEYARQLGVSPAGPGAAVALLFNSDFQTITSYTNIPFALTQLR